MKIEDLKKQFDEIEKKIEAGETVEINFSEGGESVRLEVDSSGAKEVSEEEESPLESVGDEPAKETYNFNLSESDVSDSEITDIMDESSKYENAGDLPNVILARPDNTNWILYEDCSYLTKLGYTLKAIKGYETDLASIPRVFWAIIASFELSLAAPLFHDLLYRCGGVLPTDQLEPRDGKKFERKEADQIFLEIMEKADVPKWKRESAYYAVRGFASFAWKGE